MTASVSEPAGGSRQRDVFDDEHHLALLRACSITAIGIFAFFVPLDLIAGRMRDAASIAGFIFLGISAFTGLVFHRLRRPTAGWVSMVSMLWCTETTFALFHGGISAPSVVFYLPLVAAVATVLGGRSTIIFAAVCIATLGMFVWLESSGNLPESAFDIPAWRRAVIYAAATGALALIMWYTIAKQRQRREDLQRASERFQAVFDSSATPSVIARPSDRIHTDCNQAFCDLFGYTRDQVVGHTGIELGLFRDLGERDRIFDEYVAAGRVLDVEHDMMTATGEVRRVLRSLTAIDMGGERMTLVQIIDITERKRAEDELRANRRLLEVVIDAMPMSIFAKDLHSNYVMVNQYMADFYRKSKEDLLRRHTSDLPIPDETRQKSLRDDAWVYENRAVLDQNLAMLQNSTGMYVPFHSTKIPLFGDDGELIGLLGINRDITDERRVQEELRASRRLLEIVIDSIPMYVFAKDLRGRYIVVNKQSAEFYGTTREAMLERGTSHLPLSGSDKMVALDEDAWVHKHRMPLVKEESLREVAAGKVVPMHCTKIPLFDDDGELVGVLGVLRDISQEKKAADDLSAARRALEEANATLEQTVAQRTAELQRANAELGETLQNLMSSQEALVRSEKLAALGRLVAGVAHELNTPIGNSLLSASALAERTDEFAQDVTTGKIADLGRAPVSAYVEDAREAAQILLRNLEKAGEIIRSFKQVATDQASSQRRDFSLVEVVEEVLLAHRPMLRNSPVEIRTEISADLWLDSYPGPLGQVLGNLITNAVMHGYEDMDRGIVEVSARPHGPEKIELVVRDHGHGISADNMKRIFDPFFTTRMGRGGTGLGLGICYNIVIETLGGSINVESIAGGGTTVEMLIPVAAPSAPVAASAA